MKRLAEKTYTTIDKADWGEGPWQHEPDKVQWKDEATGLPCLAKRNNLGVWCGYVGVASEHPLYKLSYNDVDLYAHGSLSYSDSCQEGDEATSICHIPEPGEPDDVWWFGFDCGHAGDIMPWLNARENKRFLSSFVDPDATYCTLDYVTHECASLAKQLYEGGTTD